MEFKFFKDPLNFTFLKDNPQPCSICVDIGVWFDASGYVGIQQIECVCANCLKSGRLVELEIEANSVCSDETADAITVMHKTPALPTWQDIAWPSMGDEFPVFERIASKCDFDNHEQFISSHINSHNDKNNFSWLWRVLPEQPLNNYKEAGDVSVYLFSFADRYVWVSDAN